MLDFVGLGQLQWAAHNASSVECGKVATVPHAYSRSVAYFSEVCAKIGVSVNLMRQSFEWTTIKTKLKFVCMAPLKHSLSWSYSQLLQSHQTHRAMCRNPEIQHKCSTQHMLVLVLGKHLYPNHETLLECNAATRLGSPDHCNCSFVVHATDSSTIPVP